MDTLPTLFLSHGAPTLPLEPGSAKDDFAALGRELRRPEAVLCVSAHWETAAPAVSGAQRPETIHDFHGFPAELYEIQYPAPGAPELAGRVALLLGEAGFEASVDEGRGLDHGAWVPMRLMYPDADVKVAQLSLQTNLGPAHHLALGRALAPLRAEGVLILASGSATHNLRDFGAHEYDSPAPPAVLEFEAWLKRAVAEGDVGTLLDYRALAPHAALNHPSDEHLLPLFVAVGAANQQVALGAATPTDHDPETGNGRIPGRLVHASHTWGILSMASFAWD